MRTPDSFAVRMKNYEAVSQNVLMHRTPVIIRVDGKGFSKLTRSMNKPFDEKFLQCMQAAAVRLAVEAQGCRLAYTQSDEISLLLTDYKTLNTEAWFRGEVQKLCSISAAIATVGFCEEFIKQFPDRAREELPVFDGRCFNLPREDVTNYFVWRQRDAERNSISMLAQAHFSPKELHGMSRDQMKDMLVLRKGIDWSGQPEAFKRGSVVLRELQRQSADVDAPVRAKWVVTDAPVFTANRDVVERLVRDEEVTVP